MTVLEKILQEINEIHVDDVDFGVECNIDEKTDLSCDNCYECIKNVCCQIIRSHMEDDGWIPAEERLPEKTIETFDGVFSSEVVLVTTINENGETHCSCDFLIGERWACALKEETVTAWQPLPAPYQPKPKEQ